MPFLYLIVLVLIMNASALPSDDILDPRVDMALETIDSEDVYAYISYMASDALYGRNAGEPGNDMAAEWIAEFFGRLGLKPGGDDGTYFQSFEFKPRRFTFSKEDGDKKRVKKVATTRNVVAVWEGSHPVLKKEAVVVGAHFDHVGKKGSNSNPGRMGRANMEDGIWNGADDNASGTAGVLEIAQAFAALKLKTPRSIVFVLFSAEEHGLYGSKHYVDHPTFPMEDTLAMVNLDMIGRNPRQPVSLIGAMSAKDGYLKDLAASCAEEVSGLELDFSSGMFGGSDHMPFLTKKVPAVFFFTGLHKDYHNINDEVDRIDCDRASKIIKTAFLMLYTLSHRSEPLAFSSEGMSSSRRGIRGRGNRRMLGVTLGKLVTAKELEGYGFNEDQGAARVANVNNDSSAEKAGLKAGDLILSLGTVRIRAKESVTSLREGIDSARSGTEMPMEVLRDGDIVTLTILWPESRQSDSKEK